MIRFGNVKPRIFYFFSTWFSILFKQLDIYQYSNAQWCNVATSTHYLKDSV